MGVIKVILIVIAILYIIQRLVPAKDVRNITPTELQGILKNKDIQFVDIRSKWEYDSNHIKQFINIPLNKLNRRANSELSKDKEVVVICQSGIRSIRASKILKRKGFTNVTNVKGGIGAIR